MNRIYFIGITIIIGIMSFFIFNNDLNSNLGKEKTNIVVIIADDLDLHSVNLLLEYNLLPNLKNQLINKGITFSNFFVTNPTCCPSRATFLTGQYSHNHGVYTNSDIKAFNDNSTLAATLSNAGYTTGFIGKYLNGYGKTLPETYVPPGWEYWQVLIEKTIPGIPYQYGMYNYSISNNGIINHYGDSVSDYQTDVLGEIAKSFIIKSASDRKPFFLILAPFAPHEEQSSEECSLNVGSVRMIRGSERYSGIADEIKFFTKPSYNETDTSDKPEWVQKVPILTKENGKCLESLYKHRLEAIIGIDNLIGAIIDTLQDTDEIANTVIIFTSDNGYSLGEHRLSKKNNPYEESIKVPLYIRAPNFPLQQYSSKLVINNDLAPTILDLARVSSDFNIDGRSLKPLLRNPDDSYWREKILIEHWGGGIVPNYLAVRSSTQIYIQYENSEEFYDLQTDPYQLDNLWPCMTKVCIKKISEFKVWLSNLKSCKGMTCIIFEN